MPHIVYEQLSLSRTAGQHEHLGDVSTAVRHATRLTARLIPTHSMVPDATHCV